MNQWNLVLQKEILFQVSFNDVILRGQNFIGQSLNVPQNSKMDDSQAWTWNVNASNFFFSLITKMWSGSSSLPYKL